MATQVGDVSRKTDLTRMDRIMKSRQIRTAVRGAVLALFVGILGVQQAEAQRPGRMGGPRGGTGIGGPMNGGVNGGQARGVERAMRLADELGLSDAQRGELEVLRLQQLEDQTSAAVRMLELGSEVRAGIREPEALRQEMEALREARQSGAAGVRDQLQQVLTEEQIQELQELSRPGRGGRAGFRGRGMQQGRRNFQGLRGRGRGRSQA